MTQKYPRGGRTMRPVPEAATFSDEGPIAPQESPHRAADDFGYYVRNEPVTAKTCYFYSDGNQFRQPLRVPIAWDRYRNINSLLQDLTVKVTDLRYGVRAIFTPQGRHRISNLRQLKDEGDYVCSDSRVKAKGVDIYRIHVPSQWHGGRPPSPTKRYNDLLRSAKQRSTRRRKERRQTRSLPTSNSSQDSGGATAFSNVVVSRPGRGGPSFTERRAEAKRILVSLNGDSFRRHVVKIDRRTAGFEQVMEDLASIFGRPLKKMFDAKGEPVSAFHLFICSLFLAISLLLLGAFDGTAHERNADLRGELWRATVWWGSGRRR